MPITRKQFEVGIDPKIEEWMKTIHSFLYEHKNEGFTEEELREQYRPTLFESLSDEKKKFLETRRSRDPFHILSDENRAFELALEKLVELRAAAKAIIRDTEYYAVRKKLEEVF